MYPHFIEVHDVDVMNDANECSMCINIDNICGFNPYCDDQQKTVIGMVDDTFHVVTETYDELKQLITNAGCLINKGDPRLDTQHPLTMKDIEEMNCGEPVWDSNRDEWYLLRRVNEDGSVWFGDVFGNKAVLEREEDLLKVPLYRMKVQK